MDELAVMREEFQNILLSTERKGMPELLEYLETTDFYFAPSSTQYHDAKVGGLVDHSLKVYGNMVRLNNIFQGNYKEDTLKIVGLLHDLCKVNFYTLEKKSLPRKDDKGNLVFDDFKRKIWDETTIYIIEDQLPLGHGEKSVILTQRFISLTTEEIMAIRWHMGGYDDLHSTYAGNLAITSASDKFPLIILTHIADLSASFLKVRS